MRVFRSPAQVPADFGPSVVTIGNFDGVHQGHRQIMRRVVELARQKGCVPTVLTFDPHPARVLAPERAPKLLMTIDQRLRAMEQEGIDAVLLIPFSLEFAALTPGQFAEQTLAATMKARMVLVGTDFRFGCKQSGNIETLRELGGRFGFGVEPISGIERKGERISSTGIRSRISRGEVSKACRLLGAPFTLEGNVVRGHGIGSKQTVPTLNLAAENEVLPAVGVYVTRTRDLDTGREWNSITNVGYRPTFGGDALTIETYLLQALDREDVIERETYARARARIQEYITQYRARFGDCFSSDKAAELFPEYAATTNASQLVADRAFLERIAESDDAAVEFVMGGPGAGKTTSSQAAVARGSIVFDGSAVHAERLIGAAAASGRMVEIHYIHRDPTEAFRGTLDRAMNSPTERGRVIPLRLHEQLHRGSAEAIERIEARYAGNSSVTIRYEVNSSARPPRTGSIEEVRKTRYSGLGEQLRHVLDNALTAGRISTTIYDRVREGPGVRTARGRGTTGDSEDPHGEIRRVPGPVETAGLGSLADIGRIAVSFLTFVRPERKFESPEALKTQILRDISVANRLHRRLALHRVG
jgi:riboflavin kinase / FMN adenylyltransferase